MRYVFGFRESLATWLPSCASAVSFPDHCSQQSGNETAEYGHKFFHRVHTLTPSPPTFQHTHTHTYTHARTHARTHALTHAHSYSQFRDEYSIDQIKSSRMIHEPLTKLQCWYASCVAFNTILIPSPSSIGTRLYWMNNVNQYLIPFVVIPRSRDNGPSHNTWLYTTIVDTRLICSVTTTQLNIQITNCTQPVLSPDVHNIKSTHVWAI